MNIVTEDVKGAIIAHDVEICKLVRELGGTKSTYARERAAAIRAMVAEIYSAPYEFVPGISGMIHVILQVNIVEHVRHFLIPLSFICH